MVKEKGKNRCEIEARMQGGHVCQLGSGMQLLQGKKIARSQVQRAKRVGVDCLDVKGEDMGI